MIQVMHNASDVWMEVPIAASAHSLGLQDLHKIVCKPRPYACKGANHFIRKMTKSRWAFG